MDVNDVGLNGWEIKRWRCRLLNYEGAQDGSANETSVPKYGGVGDVLLLAFVLGVLHFYWHGS